ncbi:helix-turn-helix transcriptional regulator [Pseudomonas extremorientalis]|uniref:helix-turn-helix domain-containing protein n=1 Tax=Pseudomonas extremorientalis TaxID=169669 RepID=UPI0027370C77|nr:helix-turn-helix transcriptional regulator [Pseudomonas extremorientalis]WLG56733.1 helix-turn-helix transcriptional regulator [Pseudomonas extremorientalis]
MTDVRQDERIQIGDRLRRAREYMGLSQDEVASVLGLPRPSVTNMEQGARKVDAIELNKLAKLYRRTLDYLMTGTEPAGDGPEQLAFLARAVKGLSEKDVEEVARFAEFLKHSVRPK